jgi:signal transduction histidine kinase/CheY-like chemotaxis protein
VTSGALHGDGGSSFDAGASALEDGERHYRADRVQSALLVVALGMFALFLTYSFAARPLIELILGIGCIGILIARAWARTPPAGAWSDLPIHLAIGVASIAVVSNTFRSGSLLSVGQYYLILIPAFASCLLSLRATFGWALVAILGFALTRLAAPWWVRDVAPLSALEVVFAQSFLVLMIFGASFFQWATTRRYVEGIQASKRLIRDQADLLTTARDAALQASRLKSEFLATMSHEIRTPMNAVLGLTEVMLDTKLDDEQRDMLETVRRSGDSLLEILNDILDFSKIESGMIELDPQPFAVRTCIEEAMELLAQRAAERRVELYCDQPRDVPNWVIGDASRVRQILVNLISNAVKFTRDGEVVIQVRQATGPDREPCLRIVVRDTGIGIPEERRDRLFKPFSQVDASTTRRFGGTGLGLVISKRLVGLMGGTIEVESEPDRGSEFSVTLPAPPAPGTPMEVRFGVSSLEGRHLLMVHQHAGARAILTRDAGAYGVPMRAAGSLTEALAWVRAGERFDAALLDARVVEREGTSDLAEIRASLDGPTVLMTLPGEVSGRDLADLPLRIGRPLRARRLGPLLVRAWTERARDPNVARSRPAGHLERTASHPLQILVAEDNLVNQRVIVSMLTRLGHRVDVVDDGSTAVEAVQRQRYDLVLMDLQMPKMDGLAATRAIRALGGHASLVRIVALTANAMKEDQSQCLGAGMDDFLPKPASKRAVMAALERAEAAMQGLASPR